MSGALAPPGEDEVHLWKAPLDLDLRELAVLETFLSADESERAQHFRLDRDRGRYSAARGWLRWLLACYLDVDPSHLTFSQGAFGKPELTRPAGCPLRFNLAHSAGLAVFAIASRCEVGVDVECIRPDFPADAVAERFLSSEERLSLAALPPDDRRRVFFDLWVRNEAYVKAIGVGLGAADAEGHAHGDRRTGWLLTAFDAGDGYAAAVAVEGRSVRVPAAAQPVRRSSLLRTFTRGPDRRSGADGEPHSGATRLEAGRPDATPR